METAWAGETALKGLASVVGAIAEGARRVHEKIQSAALADVFGATGEINVHGEAVQRLDAGGSELFVDLLSGTGRVAAVGSEEIEDPFIAGDDPDRVYVVHMDPVDGSSNIDVAVSIGSIFGIWRRPQAAAAPESWLLQPGSRQVAAAYAVYGSSTLLVTATAGSVNVFTLDTGAGEFLLTHRNVTFPDKCEYYSTNEGNFGKLDAATQRAVSRLREDHSLRYVGSLVADFHRNLLKGGIFLYPGDSKSPNGKLRLMYEANPLGYVAEQAGGAAYSASRRILDIQPENPHERTPLVIGNRAEVEKTIAIISEP